MTYRSGSAGAGSATEGHQRNGPLISHVLAQVGAIVDQLDAEFLKYQVRIRGDGMNDIWLPPRYQSIGHLELDAKVHLSEIVNFNLIGSGTFEYRFFVTYLDSLQVELASDEIWGDFTHQDLSNSPYGAGWWLKDQIELIERTDGQVCWLEAGVGGFFRRFQNGPYDTPLGMFGTLTKETTGGAHFQFVSADGQILKFEESQPGPRAGQTLWSITKMLDANGNATEFEYTTILGQRRLQSVTDPFGRTTTLSYNASGFLDTMTDFAGRITDFEITNGKLVSIKAPPVPNASGTGIIQPTLAFGYQGGLLSELISPHGPSMAFEYDANSRLIAQTNFDGSHYTYSAMFARPLAASLSLNNPPAALDNRSLRAEEIGLRGHAIHKMVNEFSQPVVRHVEPDYSLNPVVGVASKKWTRDERGRVKASIEYVQVEGSGGSIQTSVAETHYEYTVLGVVSPLPYRKWQPDLDPQVQNLATDPYITYENRNGSLKPEFIIDELGRTIAYTYDRNGNGPNAVTRRQVVGSADDVEWVYTFTDGVTAPTDGLPRGLMLTETDSLSRQTRHFYYSNSNNPLTFGRLQKVILPDQTELHFTYTFENDPTYGFSVAKVTETDELLRSTSRYFDALGRLIRIERPHPSGSGAPTVTTYRYDANGNLVAEIDAQGNDTLYVYDAQNRLIEIRQPDPDDLGPQENGPLSRPITRFTYDPAGNRRARIDAEGRITTYQYDAANRLFAIVQPDVDGQWAPTRSRWTNPVFRYDVNADGVVSLLDTQAIDAFLAGVVGGSVSLSSLNAPETYAFYTHDLNGVGGINRADQPLYFDVNGDLLVNAADRTLVQAAIGVSPMAGPDYGDPLGRAVTRYTFDPAGNRLSETDPLGRTTHFRYDIRSRRIKTIQPQVPDPQNNNVLTGPITTYTYDAASQLTSVRDALGRVTRYVFDDLGRRVMEIKPDADGILPIWQNPVQPLDVNQDGRIDSADIDLLDSALDENNHWFNGYFTVRPWLNSQGPQQDQFPIDVNGDGQLTPTDKNLVVEYLASGFVDPVLWKASPVTRWVYDRASNLRFLVDAMGSVTEWQYDQRNRRTFVIEQKPTGPRRQIGLTEPDVPGDALSLAAQGYPVQETVYDAVARIDYVKDYRRNAAQPRSTDYTWNALDQLVTLSLPDADGNPGGSVYHFTYNLLGSRTSATDAEGHTTTYVLDNLYRLIREVRPQVDNGSGVLKHPITTFHYDATGLRVQTVDPLGRETEFLYDGAGRLKRQWQPNPITGLAQGANRPSVEYGYDLAGNRVSQKNGKGETQHWCYDSLNRLVLSQDELQYVTSFTYDLTGNLLSLTDPNGNQTQWQYDRLNRKVHEQNALNHTRVFTHDLQGNLASKTDRRGWVTQYERDHLYRMVWERWYDGSTLVRQISFSHDLAGNLRTSSDPAFSYSYTPDELDRVRLVNSTFAGLAKDVELDLDCDRNHNRKAVAARLLSGADVTKDFVTQYTYDTLHRMAQVTQFAQAGGNGVAPKRVDMKYDLFGHVKSIQRRAGLLASDPLVVDSQYTFDKAGRLFDLNHVNGTNPSQMLADYAWNWDIANRISSFTSAYPGDGLANYDYDDAGQLISATYHNAGPHQLDEEYAYDPNGNRISAAYTDNNPITVQAYWRLNEATGTTTADASGNGLTASFGGTPAWITTGLPPKILNNPAGLYFDSAGDFLSVNNSTPLQVGTNDFSASAWVRFDPGINQDMMIFAHGNPNLIGGKGIEFLYRGSVSTKPLILRINDGVPDGDVFLPPQQLTYLTQGGLADNQWHHLGFTIDRDGQIVLYVDGLAVRAATSTKHGNINPSTPFYIGRATAGPQSNNLRGRIDEIRVYRHALSPAVMRNQFLAKDHGFLVTSKIGANNQILLDDRYSFTYDAEGNRSQRIHTLGMAVEHYTWDHRNRLTSVSQSGPREAVQFDFESDHGDLIIDNLGNAMDGFLENGPLVVGTIPHGGHTRALMLDGANDFGNLGIQDWFRPQAAGFTLGTWLYPQYKQTEMALLGFGSTEGNQVGYALTMAGSVSQTSPSQLNFTISDGSGSSQTVTYTHTSSLLDTWHHVGVIIDGAGVSPRSVRLYLNSQLVKTEPLSETIPFGSVLQPFVLGAKSGGSASYFRGQLDDVRIIPYALASNPSQYFQSVMQSPYPATMNTMHVSYRYDHQNRLISRTTDLDGHAGPAVPFTEYFIHDGVPLSPSPPSSGEKVAEGAMSSSSSPASSPLANPDAA